MPKGPRTSALVSLALAGLVATTQAQVDSSQFETNVKARSQEIHVYAGGLFGDKLTDSNISERQPELDDAVTFGLRYGYNVTNAFGAEVSLGYSPNSATKLAGDDIDLDLYLVDANAIWHFYDKKNTPWVPYLTAGVGYAWADFDSSIRGTLGGNNISIGGDSSFTANAGFGVKYFATERLMIRFDARYRYLDALTDRYDSSLNTFETTLGIGWRF